MATGGESVLTRDKEGVLKVWNMHKKPMWSIWQAKGYPSFSCCSDDEAEVESMLLETLDFIKASGSTASYVIKFHDECNKNGKISNTTPVIGSLGFKLNEAGMAPARSAGMPAGDQYMQLFIQEKFDRLEEKYQRQLEYQQRQHEEELAELENQVLQNQEPEDQDGVKGIIGYIANLGTQHSWLADEIKGWSTILRYKFQQATGGRPQQHATMAGVADTAAEAATTSRQKVEHALKILAGYYCGKNGAADRGLSPEDKQACIDAGWQEMATDLTLLAGLTQDPDVMELALKKLHQLG